MGTAGTISGTILRSMGTAREIFGTAGTMMGAAGTISGTILTTRGTIGEISGTALTMTGTAGTFSGTALAIMDAISRTMGAVGIHSGRNLSKSLGAGRKLFSYREIMAGFGKNYFKFILSIFNIPSNKSS